jgi:hypothetical protein
MYQIQSKLANNESLSLREAISLQEIMKNDQTLKKKKSKIYAEIAKYESLITDLENKKKRVEVVSAINRAAESDVQKFSKYYFILPFCFEDTGDEEPEEVSTDDAIPNYLGNISTVCNLDEIPHQDAKFASIYATLASSALTGLFFYYAWRDNYEARGLVPILSTFILSGEFLVCDMVLDAFYPTSTLAYYVSSGIRIAIPTIVGGFILAEKINSFAESRTGLRPR